MGHTVVFAVVSSCVQTCPFFIPLLDVRRHCVLPVAAFGLVHVGSAEEGLVWVEIVEVGLELMGMGSVTVLVVAPSTARGAARVGVGVGIGTKTPARSLGLATPVCTIRTR